jgi:TolB-like protein/tRNA A-37 threonylcarbamoyl transferase component Bud32/Flp pilus assembly protein TadD
VTDSPRLDLRDQLQATLGSAYTLEHELTGGAMSRVFAAKDTVLARRIVVKVLSPELAEGVSADRFAREIRIAASLQQANIVPVLATGATNGLPFYTMPFVDGLSLRERLKRDGALTIRETTNVLRDVARALAFAHQQGVVHRDIKPENVLLSGEAAVVTDFGIAKAISAARTTATADHTTTLTRAGMVMGTPAYMAPEQIAGEASDHRTDIYAFGCMAFELLTAQPPFYGRPAHELFAAHLTEAPAPISELRRDCPAALADLVMQCIQKDPAKRPQSARELLTALDAVGTAPQSSWPFGRAGSRRWIAAAAAAALLVFALLFMKDRNFSGDAETKSIAVLPLANIGGDSAQEYLADGITDELATALGKMRGVRVASRSLAGRYRGQRDVDVRQAGRELDVEFVLQGSVRQVGDKLRVAAQLANATDGVEIWSDSYDRRGDEAFALQADITRGVAGALNLAAGGPPADVRGTTDPEAYDLYLRGQFLLRRRGPGVRVAAENFERAIARDSNFARAHAGLAAALELFPYFAATPVTEVHDRATNAARRALQLDSSLSEAYTALGLALMHANDWVGAESHMRKAVEVDPGDHSAHHQYGRLLIYTMNTDSALAEFRRAKALDPLSALYSSWIALALSLQGDDAEAWSEITRALQFDSLNAVAAQVAARVALKRNDSRIAHSMAGRLPEQAPWNGTAGFIYARAGDRARAQSILRAIERDRSPWFSETGIAFVSLGLGDTTRALAALERATQKAENWPSFWPVMDPKFDGVRSSARFAALLKRVGLLEYVR